jgi:hypothetical protein
MTLCRSAWPRRWLSPHYAPTESPDRASPDRAQQPRQSALTQQRPTFAGVSDDERDDDLPRETRPTASPTLRRSEGPASFRPLRTSRKEISRGATPPSSSPRWHGVSNEQESVSAGVTDSPSPARAGVSDERHKVQAGVSDGAVLVLERATNRTGPQRAAVSDERLPARGSVSDGPEPVLAGATDRVTAGVTDRTAGVTDRGWSD